MRLIYKWRDMYEQTKALRGAFLHILKHKHDVLYWTYGTSLYAWRACHVVCHIRRSDLVFPVCVPRPTDRRC